MNAAERVLLPLQLLQQRHDETAHRDILSFDLYKRLKHMVLHFYKYAGKVERARDARDSGSLRRVLLDTFIICLASGNALNISLGRTIDTGPEEVADLDALAEVLASRFRASDVYADALRHLVLIGGAMAKSIESADHMEAGNPRLEMQELVPQLTERVLGLLGQTEPGLERDVRQRLASIEARSILYAAAAQP